MNIQKKGGWVPFKFMRERKQITLTEDPFLEKFKLKKYRKENSRKPIIGSSESFLHSPLGFDYHVFKSSGQPRKPLQEAGKT
jgi:hypothetical protein